MKRRQKNKIGLVYFLVVQAAILFSCNGENKLPDKVTFNEHIAPILYKNCMVCHRPGGSGHFSLEQYQTAKSYAASIDYVVKERMMPPWPADPNYTEFIGQRVLSERDKQLIAKWAAQGAPEGEGAPPTPPDLSRLSMVGTPDLQLPVQPYLLPAGSSDKFLLVKVPFELPHDTFASVIEFVPGPQNVVHHVNGDLVKYEPGKKKDVFAGARIVDMVQDSTIILAYEKLGLPNDDRSYPALQKSVVNHLPGVFALKYPEGIGGYRLPAKGAFLLNDLHYGFTDKEVLDSSYINVFFSRLLPERPAMEFQLGTLGVSPVEPDMRIEPNTVKKVYSRYTVPQDISILTINPHMHLLGKSFKAYAVSPSGDTIRLISIPRWDFNWQYFYTFKKMVKIPKGSLMVAEGVYDNTRQNLNNPFSPPRLVTDQNGSMKSTDEMFQFIVTYVPYREGDEHLSLEVK